MARPRARHRARRRARHRVGTEQGERSSAPGREGRQLTAAPASQRKTWHHSILHSFADPSSCGLHAELHSDATGPMDITRSSDGNVTMGYGGTPSATQPGAFELNHPANCRTATLRINHPVTTTGDLAVGGAHHSPVSPYSRPSTPVSMVQPGSLMTQLTRQTTARTQMQAGQKRLDHHTSRAHQDEPRAPALPGHSRNSSR